MAQKAADQARTDLVTSVCVRRFLAAPDAATQLASLKAAQFWQKSAFIEKGGWASLPGLKSPVTEAASACADRLASMDIPPKQQASHDAENTVTTQ
jgi:hypothetical protein